MKKLNVKKDDTVVVIAGKDKGKKGKIMVAFPQEERLVVQNVNMVTRHVKPRRQGEQGGRIETTEIDGRKYLLVPAEGLCVNGLPVQA